MRLYLFLVILFSSLVSRGTDLSITTFNLKWYGLGGILESDIGDEYRETWVEDFLTENNFYSDLMLFQEVVDPEALQEFLGSTYNCSWYLPTSKKHQLPVTCTLSKFSTNKKQQSLDITLNNRGLRKALITEVLIGGHAALVVNLHLKAKQDASGYREEQISLLADYLVTMRKKYSTVIIGGDFNSYSSDRTGKGKNDIDLFTDILNQNLTSGWDKISFNNPHFTFKSGRYSRQFDHILWQDKNTVELKSHKSHVTCDPEHNNFRKTRFENHTYFKHFVSDHCPLQIILKQTTNK